MGRVSSRLVLSSGLCFYLWGKSQSWLHYFHRYLVYEHRRVSTGMCVRVCVYVAEIRPQYLVCVGSDQSLGPFCLSLLSVGIDMCIPLCLAFACLCFQIFNGPLHKCWMSLKWIQGAKGHTAGSLVAKLTHLCLWKLGHKSVLASPWALSTLPPWLPWENLHWCLQWHILQLPQPLVKLIDTCGSHRDFPDISSLSDTSQVCKVMIFDVPSYHLLILNRIRAQHGFGLLGSQR